MNTTFIQSPVRRRWCKALLALCASAWGVNVQATGIGTRTRNPDHFFDGRMLEMAKAIQSNDMARLRQLAADQNLNQPGRQDMTLLWFAIQSDPPNLEAVKTLISLGADPAIQPIGDIGTPLDYAFLNRKNPDDTSGVKLLEAMLDGGMSANQSSSSGMTLLQKAAGPRSGSLKLTQLLLERGADINACDRLGGTALDQAITANHTNIAMYLVQHGANVETYTVNGVTIGWSVKWILERMQPGPVRTQFEQLRDLMISKGMKWPPDSPDAMRDQMRARGEES